VPEITVSMSRSDLRNNFYECMEPFNLKKLKEEVKEYLMKCYWEIGDVKAEWVEATGDPNKSYAKFTVDASVSIPANEIRDKLKLRTF
jgi:hypothetical protein